MKDKIEKRLKVIGEVILFTVLLAAAVVTPYLLSVSEPTKIVLLGAALVGVAIWGKKHLKPQSHP